MLSIALFALPLVAAQAGGAIPPSNPYQLVVATPGNVQTCKPTTIQYTITPELDLGSFGPVLLSIDLFSSDGGSHVTLSQDAMLSQHAWIWDQVRVEANEYLLYISTVGQDLFTLNGTSDPFPINAVDTSCLPPGGGQSQPPSSPSSTLPPSSTGPITAPPTSTNSNSVSQSSSTSSASSSPILLPTNATPASHSSAGLKAGVSVAAIAVVFSSLAALYWFFVTRHRQRLRSPLGHNRFAGYGPGYDGLGSRDEHTAYAIDPKPPVDPLGRTFPGTFAAGGAAVSSYSRSEFLDEKSLQSAGAIGGSSSNGATVGHGGSDSLSALGFMPSVPPPVTYHNPVPLVTRSTSHSTYMSTATDGLHSHEGSLDTPDTPIAAVSLPKRTARKPVPAYSDVLPRGSGERRNRGSLTSLTNTSYPNSVNELPLQPNHPAPGQTLNHKGSFGESKPMNHVLMPDMPLSQE